MMIKTTKLSKRNSLLDYIYNMAKQELHETSMNYCTFFWYKSNNVIHDHNAWYIADWWTKWKHLLNKVLQVLCAKLTSFTTSLEWFFPVLQVSYETQHEPIIDFLKIHFRYEAFAMLESWQAVYCSLSSFGKSQTLQNTLNKKNSMPSICCQ